MTTTKAILVAALLCLGWAATADKLMFMDGILNNVGHGVDMNTTGSNFNDLLGKMASTYGDRDQVIVAHSQGGLRALAYAQLLKTKGDSSRVKAIVTVGSPIQGEHALLYGSASLNSRLNNRVNSLKSTYNYIVTPVVITQQALNALGVKAGDLGFLKDGDSLVNWAFGQAGEKANLVKAAMSDPNLGMNENAIKALTPGSKFQQDYIFPGTEQKLQTSTNTTTTTVPEYHSSAGYWVTRLTGYVTVPVVVGWRWIFPIVQYVRKPVYVTYYVLPSYWVTFTTQTTTSTSSYYVTVPAPRLSSNVKLGHVTGGGVNASGSNIFQMLEDFTGGSVKAAALSASCLGVTAATGLAGTFYAGTAAGLVSSCGPVGALASVPFIAASISCADTSIYFSNFNKNFSNEMYLTTDHDGLVDTPGMVYPDGNANGWLNIDKARSTRSFPELNHMTERTSPKVWGEGSFGTNKIGSYGAVYDLLVGTKTTIMTDGEGAY
jgi:Alpha/beta hydrolase of unknown function (DUF915).